MSDPFRPLWDFNDLDATECRFRALRAEALTQLARVEGLRDRFWQGEQMLDALVDESDDRVRIRVDLERGRLRRSSGDKQAALPFFESAYAAATAAGEGWLAGDAAHMCALASPDFDTYVAWTNRGIDLAERSDAAAYWLGPLLNNLGWEHYDRGDYESALETFNHALAVREREPDKTAEIEIAREAIGEALKALGRATES